MPSDARQFTTLSISKSLPSTSYTRWFVIKCFDFVYIIYVYIDVDSEIISN